MRDENSAASCRARWVFPEHGRPVIRMRGIVRVEVSAGFTENRLPIVGDAQRKHVIRRIKCLPGKSSPSSPLEPPEDELSLSSEEDYVLAIGKNQGFESIHCDNYSK